MEAIYKCCVIIPIPMFIITFKTDKDLRLTFKTDKKNIYFKFYILSFTHLLPPIMQKDQ